MSPHLLASHVHARSPLVRLRSLFTLESQIIAIVGAAIYPATAHKYDRCSKRCIGSWRLGLCSLNFQLVLIDKGTTRSQGLRVGLRVDLRVVSGSGLLRDRGKLEPP